MKRIVAIIVLTLGILVSGLFGVLKCNEVNRLKLDLTISERSFVEMKRLKENAAISASKMVSKDSFDKVLNETKELKEELSKQKVEYKYRTVIKTVTKYVEVKETPSDKVIVKDKITEYQKDIRDSRLLHIATAKFKHPSSKPWSYKVHPIKTKITVVVGDKKGVPTIGVEALQTDKEGKTAPLPLVDVSTIIQRPSKPSWSIGVNSFQLELYGLYAFHRGLDTNQGVGVGLGSHIFKLDVGNKNVLRFVGIVAGYQAGAIGLSLHPVSLNLGSFIPILKDTYITIGFGGAFLINNQTFSPLINIGIGSTL